MRYFVFCLINIKYIFAIQKKVVIFVNASVFILNQCNLNIIMGSLIVSSPTSIEIWEDQANYIWTNLKQISTHNLETAQTLISKTNALNNAVPHITNILFKYNLLPAFRLPHSKLWAIIEGQPHSPSVNTAFFLHIQPKDHQKPCNKVGSLNLVEGPVDIDLETFDSDCNPLGHSPHCW